MTRAHGTTRARVFALIAAAVAASVPTALPAQTQYSDFREAAFAALGGPVDTLELAGAGWDACLGQAWAVTEGWARWELSNYRRVIDYRNGTSVQSAQRRAGLDPARVGGCGAQAGAAATAQQSSIRAEAGFSDKLPIWLTPHGFLQLADAHPASITRAGNGRRVTVRVDTADIEYTVVAEYNADNLPTTIRTWIDDPIFGDMEVTTALADYRDFGALRLPASLTLEQGGLATLKLTFESAQAGVAAPEFAAARGLAAGAARGGGGGRSGGAGRGSGAELGGGGAATAEAPAYVEMGNGVFVMPGSYQGVAVEFDDFVVAIDGMQSDARTAEIIGLIHTAIPNKPVRYVVMTHSHFDHASGLRQYAAEGATIISHEIDADFLERALATPRTLNPNRFEPESVNATIMGVGERMTIRDESGQRVDLLALAPSAHAADMLIGYLPSIRTVVEADLLQPWINPIFAGSGDGPNPYLVYLYDEIERLGLDVAQFIPIHTPPEPPTMPMAALEEALGRR